MSEKRLVDVLDEDEKLSMLFTYFDKAIQGLKPHIIVDNDLCYAKLIDLDVSTIKTLHEAIALRIKILRGDKYKEIFGISLDV